ncbi:hypothetical protein ACS4JF_30855 [Bacillus thuringiensis]|uniref:hypothetical protein n=1 Tax=Bacillus thuringiensis TaxID=1428 RepID=UPI001FAD5282|nr:hypothetical protein [Bacillus thuringiensis]MDM8361576.1 hypothetical protein [Bacillus thuringiensis]
MMGIMFADNRKNKGLFFQEPKGKKNFLLFNKEEQNLGKQIADKIVKKIKDEK